MKNRKYIFEQDGRALSEDDMEEIQDIIEWLNHLQVFCKLSKIQTKALESAATNLKSISDPEIAIFNSTKATTR